MNEWMGLGIARDWEGYEMKGSDGTTLPCHGG